MGPPEDFCADNCCDKAARKPQPAPHENKRQYTGAVACLLPPLYIAIWMAVSSGLIILNKKLMVDDGFNFPLALTGAGQAASFMMGKHLC